MGTNENHANAKKYGHATITTSTIKVLYELERYLLTNEPSNYFKIDNSNP